MQDHPHHADANAHAQAPEITLDEIKAFAARYGLTKLAPAHLERMRELAVSTAKAGAALPRVATKAEGLPSTLRLIVL